MKSTARSFETLRIAAGIATLACDVLNDLAVEGREGKTHSLVGLVNSAIIDQSIIWNVDLDKRLQFSLLPQKRSLRLELTASPRD